MGEVFVFSADGRWWYRRVLVWDRNLFDLVVEGEHSNVLVMRVRSRIGSMILGLVDWEESRSGRYRDGYVGGGHD